MKELSKETFHDIQDAFGFKVFAFTPGRCIKDGTWTIGVAVANETGYSPVSAFHCRADTYHEMEEYCDKINGEYLGLDIVTSMRIVASTMKRG